MEPFIVGDDKVRKCLVGGGNPVFIAGPCVIESEEFTLSCADKLHKIAEKYNIQLIFKASYDKANRTSVNSFRGPGYQRGLKILERVRREIGLPVLSDVHCKEEIQPASEVLDVIQIPAFLARQTDMLVFSGKTGKPINIKKPQFASPYDTKYMLEKVMSTGNKKVMICERGTAFGYRDLVVDFRSIPIMRKWSFVIFDGTHTTQKPSAGDGISDGERWLSPYLTRAAASVGVDGFFHEVHPDPDRALSDPKTSINFQMFEMIIKQVKRIIEINLDSL
ncbi:MAG: 3-deoxy-8-phosphooctulonate synthase [bacterium]|nr:3-deoxy-8-phosphooctulonate synthase [bacterium]